MFLSPTPNVSLQSLREQSAGKTIVLLYPWPNINITFLQYYLTDDQSNILYWRPPRLVSDLRVCFSDMGVDISTRRNHFGEYIRGLAEGCGPEHVARALLDDLQSLSPQALLYLDTTGELPSEIFLSFVDVAAHESGHEMHIVLSSHLLAYGSVRTLVEQGYAVVLRPVRRRQELFFTAESNLKPQLEVLAFGDGIALLDGKEIDHWDGVLPRLLFYYLVDHPFATRDDIFLAFWRRSSLKDATDIFHVTKHKVSEVLSRYAGSPGGFEITNYTQGLYMPDENIWRHYDVHEFESTVERASNIGDEREIELLLKRALDLYQAPYLQGTDAEWVIRRRAELATRYGDALHRMARILSQRGQLDAACDHYERALVELPGREDVHRALIRLLLQQGKLDRAREQYRAIEHYLDRHLGVGPSSETIALRDEIDAQSR